MSVHNIIPNLEDTKEVIKSCKSKDRQVEETGISRESHRTVTNH
jgi:hypothetical protein